jgi:fermentation-respiration switch protein FrsA (DUF1100 family)
MPHALERFFVYYPIKEVEGDPSRIGLDFEDLSLITDDGVRIHGWFVPCPGSRHTLLVLHGNAGNIGHRLPLVEILHELGAHVLIIDYRGYGRSQGNPFEEGLYRDARAAAAFWVRRFPEPGQRLVLMGKSLGGPVAVDLATHFPVSGLILQSTFTSAWDMAKTLLPIGLLQPLSGVHLDAAAKIGSIRCPKLFIHGSRDEIVPFRLGKKLFDLAPEPKQFLEVPGAGHNDLIWVAGAGYSRAIRDFLAGLDSPRRQ